MKKFTILLILILLLGCPIVNADTQVAIPDESYGVLYIPCLDLEMPIYTSEVDDHDHRQAVIDDEESALINNWGTAYKIGDHIGSFGAEGEWYIQKIFPGAYAYFYTNDGRYYYECYMTAKTEYDGNEYMNGRLVTPCSSKDIMLTCCAEDTSHHFIAVFRLVKEF